MVGVHDGLTRELFADGGQRGDGRYELHSGHPAHHHGGDAAREGHERAVLRPSIQGSQVVGVRRPGHHQRYDFLCRR